MTAGVPREVLVVDDDAIGRDLLATIFRRSGCSVSVAASGEECLRLLTEVRPQLILLDVVLPDIAGTDLCARIRSDPAQEEALVILVSGKKISPADHVLGLDVGADDYVERPFGAEEILARVRALSRLKESTKRRYRGIANPFSVVSTNESAKIFGQEPLQRAQPEVFAQICGQYAEALSRVVDGRLHGTQAGASDQLQELAHRLGFLKASARDLVDLHTSALERMSPGSSARRALFIREEGRLVLVELMGHVMNYYRQRA